MWGLLSDGGQHHKATIPGHPNTPHKVRKRHVLQGVTARNATSHASINTKLQQTTTNVKHHLQTEQAKQDDLLVGQHRMPMSARHEACAWNDCAIGLLPCHC